MKNKGFTLIETVVALAVFSIVTLIAINSFISMLKVQRKTLAIQEAQNSLRYALESMSREIRMSHIEEDSTEDILHITAFKGSGSENVSYFLTATDPTAIARNSVTLTAEAVDILKLKFYITLAAVSSIPDRVTIVIQAETTGEYAGERINLQTTISTRDYAD